MGGQAVPPSTLAMRQKFNTAGRQAAQCEQHQWQSALQGCHGLWCAE
jgi:hypothetical protein